MASAAAACRAPRPSGPSHCRRKNTVRLQSWAAYEAGHIPGAVHTDYVADGWRAKIGQAPGLLPPRDHLAALVGRLGITPHDDVIIIPAGVSATDAAAAARIYWTLKTIGHGQQAILDGGFRAWTADPARPVETGPSAERTAPPYPVVMQQRRIPKGPAIAYCNTGHTAALNWFVLSELLGREEVALYDGSMTDWTQDPERPVATGAE
ncbi:MAG: hypothetical protein B7Z14_18730 [Bosea sp. 32-68-6]|nr:MAG: hypothetical protein B7Z14_18730 [Bosea sp. 32-68-6]